MLKGNILGRVVVIGRLGFEEVVVISLFFGLRLGLLLFIFFFRLEIFFRVEEIFFVREKDKS